MDDQNLIKKVSEIYEWKKWRDEIPFISFPSNWKIKIVPPIAGAIVRFHVTKEVLSDRISVYLDCYDMLGHMEEPYWEIYPDKEYGCSRYGMYDISGLLKGIEESLLKMENT